MDHKQVILNRFEGRWADFYGRYMDLSNARNGSVVICSPFRQEKKPSFTITFEGEHAGRWIDSGTKESGDIFAFYARLHNLDVRRAFRQILKGIADDFGIALNSKVQGAQKKKERRPKTPEEVLKGFQAALQDSELLTDLKQRRGLSNETIARFELGRWQDKIVYPVRGDDGGIDGFIVHKGPHLKPDGTVAPKGQGVKAQLYPLTNLNENDLVIAEGPPDVWRLDTAGIKAITGTAGAGTWREEWTARLKGKGITIPYDNDDPGMEGQAKRVKALKGIVRRLRYVEWPEGLPDGYDVTDWLQSGKTFSDLPLREVEVEYVTLLDVKKVFKKWIYFAGGEDVILDVILGAMVANRFSGDPVWIFIIAPPGGVKTETLRSLSEWREVYMLSSLTPSTLISGYVPKDGEDPSLLPKLNGRVLIIKDFTAILDMPREARQQILGDLRDAYDGSMSKAFGSEAGTRSYRSKFGLIAAVTPAIDRYASLSQQLGERFLKLRLTPQAGEGTRPRVKQALANSGWEIDMRAELSQAAEGALLTCDVQNEQDITISEDILDRLIDLADILAVLRSDVSRDGYTHTIDYVPVPEIGTRLVKQFAKLARGIAAIRGKSEVGEDEYRLIRRIARDTLPSKRLLLIHAIYKMYHEGFLPTKTIANEMNMPTETVRYALEDLRLLKIVNRQGEKPLEWQMSPKFSDSLETLDFFGDIETL